MDNSLIGLIGVTAIVAIAEAVGIFLRRPMGVLLRLEKGAERSDFWSAYARVVLLLVPAAFALLSFPSGTYVNPLEALVSQLRWGVAGLLIALAVTGKALRVSPPRISHAPFVPHVPPPQPSGNGPAR